MNGRVRPIGGAPCRLPPLRRVLVPRTRIRSTRAADQGFSGFGEKPLAGDVNLDGIDDIVLWVPGREGQLPKDSGEFYFLVSDAIPAPLTIPARAPAAGPIPSILAPRRLGTTLVCSSVMTSPCRCWATLIRRSTAR